MNRYADEWHAVALLAAEDHPGAQRYLGGGGWAALGGERQRRAAELFAAKYGRPMEP